MNIYNMEFLVAILILSIIYFGYNRVDLIQYLIMNNKFIDDVKIKKMFLIAEKDWKYFGKELTKIINSQN